MTEAVPQADPLAARLESIGGACCPSGHLFLLDEPQNVVGPIRAFLDED